MPRTSIRQVCACVLSACLLLLSAASQVTAQAARPATTSGSASTGASRTYVAPVAPANPPSTAPVSTAPTATAPAAADKEELPDIIYIQPLIGVGYVLLKALDSDNFDIGSDTSVDDVVVTDKGTGFRYGVAAGLNIVFIHVGGRVAFTQTPKFTLGTAQLEVALVPQLGPIEPSVRLGIGYAWQGDANYGDYQDETSVYGLALGGGLGLDVRLGQVVGIGIGLDADLLNMSRTTDFNDATTIKDGSALGIQVAFNGHLTLHI